MRASAAASAAAAAAITRPSRRPSSALWFRCVVLLVVKVLLFLSTTSTACLPVPRSAGIYIERLLSTADSNILVATVALYNETGFSQVQLVNATIRLSSATVAVGYNGTPPLLDIPDFITNDDWDIAIANFSSTGNNNKQAILTSTTDSNQSSLTLPLLIAANDSTILSPSLLVSDALQMAYALYPISSESRFVVTTASLPSANDTTTTAASVRHNGFRGDWETGPGWPFYLQAGGFAHRLSHNENLRVVRLRGAGIDCRTRLYGYYNQSGLYYTFSDFVNQPSALEAISHGTTNNAANKEEEEEEHGAWKMDEQQRKLRTLLKYSLRSGDIIQRVGIDQDDLKKLFQEEDDTMDPPPSSAADADTGCFLGRTLGDDGILV